MNKIISKNIDEIIAVYEYLKSNQEYANTVIKASQYVVDAFQSGNRVYLCGNGGSAADAQHIAAELSGKYKMDRKALPCEALQVNTSFVTAVANDFSFDHIFERAVEAFCRKGDVLIALSTSGNSPNVLNGIKKANFIGARVVGLTGSDGGGMNDMCDVLIKMPSDQTPRIQESHIFTGHLICEMVEQNLFGHG